MMKPWTNHTLCRTVTFALFMMISPLHALDQISIQADQVLFNDIAVTDLSLKTGPSKMYPAQFDWSGDMKLENTSIHATGLIDARRWQADIKTTVGGKELVGLLQLFKTDWKDTSISGSTQVHAKASGSTKQLLQRTNFSIVADEWTAELPELAIATEMADFHISGVL
jgi:hypothetical protein